MTLQLKLNDPHQAKIYFENKNAFTTGPAELKYLMEHGARPAIIDVRSASDFAEGHIPGAINLPEDEWHSLRGLTTTQMNIISCYSSVCHLAARAALLFANKGFPVMELEGGMQSWRDYEYEEEKGASPLATQEQKVG